MIINKKKYEIHMQLYCFAKYIMTLCSNCGVALHAITRCKNQVQLLRYPISQLPTIYVHM